MIHRILKVLFCCVVAGCGSKNRDPIETVVPNPKNTLTMGGESFAIVKCKLWGYLSQRDGRWYCRWCVDAEAEPRSIVVIEDGETYVNELRPSISANSIPIDVEDWPLLDGQMVKTVGKHEDVEFFSNTDNHATYTIRSMSSYELCSNNEISIHHIRNADFHVLWTADAFIHGIDCDGFTLDAVATFTGVSLSSDVSSESDVDDVEIRRIFDSVFPNGSFTQIPVKIQRNEEDNVRTVRFDAMFVPRLAERRG